MKILLKVSIAALLVLGALHPFHATACSCVPPGNPAEEAARASDVFMGEVIRVEDSQPPNTWWNRLLWRLGMGPDPTTMSSSRPIDYTFRVLEPFTGAHADTVVVASSADGASCGYRFEKGRRYVVYATEHQRELRAGLCSLTGPASDPRSGLAWLRTHRAEHSPPATD